MSYHRVTQCTRQEQDGFEGGNRSDPTFYTHQGNRYQEISQTELDKIIQDYQSIHRDITKEIKNRAKDVQTALNSPRHEFTIRKDRDKEMPKLYAKDVQDFVKNEKSYEELYIRNKLKMYKSMFSLNPQIQNWSGPDKALKLLYQKQVEQNESNSYNSHQSESNNSRGRSSNSQTNGTLKSNLRTTSSNSQTNGTPKSNLRTTRSPVQSDRIPFLKKTQSSVPIKSASLLNGKTQFGSFVDSFTSDIDTEYCKSLDVNYIQTWSQNKLFQVNKYISEKNGTEKLKLRVIKLMDPLQQNSSETIIDTTLMTYNNDEARLHVINKLYLQVKDTLYFYKIKNNIANMIKIDLSTHTLKTKLKVVSEDKWQDQLIGVIFEEADVIQNLKDVCFKCFKPEEREFDKCLAVIMTRRDHIVKQELRNVNKNTVYRSIDFNINQIGEKASLEVEQNGKMEIVEYLNIKTMLAVKGAEFVVPNTNFYGSIDYQKQEIKYKDCNDLKKATNEYLKLRKHQIYYIQEQENKQTLQRKSLALEDDFDIFLKEIIQNNKLNNKQVSLNILVFLNKNETLMQIIPDKIYAKEIYKLIKPTIDDFRFSQLAPTNLLAKSFEINTMGFKQFVPQFSNVFVNVDKNLQLGDKTFSTEQKCFGDDLKEDVMKQEIEKSEYRRFKQPRNIGSRRILLEHDDRTVWPNLFFDLVNKKVEILINQKGQQEPLKRETIMRSQREQSVFDFVDKIKLCESSVIEFDMEKINYKQNFQLCKQIKEQGGLLCYEIKEYQLTWEEKEKDDLKKPKSKIEFKYIGMKLLIQ